MDLKRDEKGNPIKDSKTGKPIGIEFRKRTEKEIEESPNKYMTKSDYINYVNEKKKEFGFVQGKGKVAKLYNNISNVMAGGKFEYNEVVRSTKKNFFTIIKEFISKFKNRNMPRLSEGNIDKIYSEKHRKIDELKIDDKIKDEIEEKRQRVLQNQNKNIEIEDKDRED